MRIPHFSRLVPNIKAKFYIYLCRIIDIWTSVGVSNRSCPTLVLYMVNWFDLCHSINIISIFSRR